MPTTFYEAFLHVIDGLTSLRRATDLLDEHALAVLRQLEMLDGEILRCLATGDLERVFEALVKRDDAELERIEKEAEATDPDINVAQLHQLAQTGQEQMTRRQRALDDLQTRPKGTSAALDRWIPIAQQQVDAFRKRLEIQRRVLGKLDARDG